MIQEITFRLNGKQTKLKVDGERKLLRVLFELPMSPERMKRALAEKM